MGRLSEKVVPSWDTDLTYRLQQLDNVLAASSKTTTNNSGKSNNPKSANSTSDEEEPEQVRKRYACPHCDARFNSCGARNSHRRKVHERFHLCHECDIAFGSAQKLDRHMKTHTGIKEFKCETCGKEFMIERNLVSSMTLFSYCRSVNYNIDKSFRSYITNCTLVKKISYVPFATELTTQNRDCKLIFDNCTHQLPREILWVFLASIVR